MTPAAVNALVEAGMALRAHDRLHAFTSARIATNGETDAVREFIDSLKPKEKGSSSAEAKFRAAVRAAAAEDGVQGG